MMSEFSLRYYKDSDGAPLWYERMSGIGPAFTVNPANAARFATEQDAWSAAAAFPLAPVDAVPSPEVAK